MNVLFDMFSQKGKMGPRVRNWCVAIAIGLIAGALFSLGITGEHLTMDDWGYIYGCPFVRDGLTFENVRRSFTEIGYDAFWMPLTFLTYMCDITLLGGGWYAHHAVNVALHVVNVLVVFWFLRDILVTVCDADDGRATVLSAVAVLFWSLHPMRAEAVTYVASRKELLWSLFALVGLHAWMRYLDDRRRSRYVLSVACCLLACLSKPTAVCFPALAYLLEVVRTRRLWPSRLRSYVPFAVIAFIVGCVVLYAQSHPIGHERLDVFGETFAWRLLNACVGFGMQLWHTVALSQVYFDYRAVFGGRPLNLLLGLSVLGACIAGFVAVLCALGRDRARRYGLLGMAVWFFVALAPVSGIMGTVNGDHAYADRYTYLPTVGLMAAGAILASGLKRKGLGALLVLTAVAAIGELRTSPAVIRSFRNDFTAFSRTLSFDPDHWRALRIVGNEYCARLGRMDEGVEMLERSLSLRPSLKTAESLAYVLAVRGASGDFVRVRELCAVVARNPRLDKHGMMLDALGTVSLREGKDGDAVRFYSSSLKASERNYSNQHTMLNLALSLANCGRRREAENVLRRLSKSRLPGIRSRCAALIEDLRSVPVRRYTWSAEPFKER